VSAIAIMLALRTAIAATPDPAAADIDAGVKLRAEGRNAEALELFKKAHAEHPSARTLAQMGLAEGSLRRWVEAEAHLAAALATHDTPWIENTRNREALEQALSSVRTHVGTLNVIGPAGAEVSTDGTVLGSLPLSAPLRIGEGTVRVHGTDPGHTPVDVEATVVGGAQTTVTLEFGPAILSPLPTAPIIDDESSVALSPSRWKTWTGASLLAASSAALVAGGIWLAVDREGTCDPPAGARCLRLYDTKTQGWIGLGVGLAAGIGGGLLLWQGLHAETHVSFALGGVNFAGRF
jgi:hypothetical protein